MDTGLKQIRGLVLVVWYVVYPLFTGDAMVSVTRPFMRKESFCVFLADLLMEFEVD